MIPRKYCYSDCIKTSQKITKANIGDITANLKQQNLYYDI